MGMILAIFFGFGRVLDFPIGMCMFDAYFYSTSIGPNDARFFTLYGFKAFPLNPFNDLEVKLFFVIPE